MKSPAKTIFDAFCSAGFNPSYTWESLPNDTRLQYEGAASILFGHQFKSKSEPSEAAKAFLEAAVHAVVDCGQFNATVLDRAIAAAILKNDELREWETLIGKEAREAGWMPTQGMQLRGRETSQWRYVGETFECFSDDLFYRRKRQTAKLDTRAAWEDCAKHFDRAMKLVGASQLGNNIVEGLCNELEAARARIDSLYEMPLSDG